MRLLLSCCFAFLSYFNLIAQSEKSTLDKIEKLKLTSDFKSENPVYIDLILELAKLKIRTNPDSTEILLKEGYQLSLDTKYRAGESRALSTYGYLYFEKGDTEKAYEYNMNALKIANTYNLSKEKLKAINNMGLDYWLQGDSSSALTKFLEGLAIATEVENVDMMVSININIANLYSDNGDYETSLSFLENAKKLNLEHGNSEILAYMKINMASEYSEIGNYIEAEKMVNESITYFEKDNVIDWLSHGYELKGSILLKQKEYYEALIWYLKSEKLSDEIDFKFGYTLLYSNMAECYLGLEKIDKAEKYALKGLEISKELNIAGGVKDANLVLSKIYYKKGQNKLAYEYQSTYIELHEKSSSEKFKKGLGILRSKMEFENQKKQLIADQEKAIAKQKNYVYIAIAALLVVLLFLILIFRTNKLQKVYTENLQEKQDALIIHEAELNESNNTKDKLFSIIAHDLKGPISSFHSLMKLYLNDSISKEDSDFLFPKALREIQGISDMLNNLLVWAKTQMDGIVLNKDNIDINTIAKDTILLLNPLAQKKEIKIINNIPENTISYSDRDHLDIIIRNLISNSIKFTNLKGEISINAIKKDDEYQIEVTDNGVGMDIETQAKLFDRKKAKSTYGTNNEKGTGLGLSICKDMVESNGGKLWVSSVPNQGTTIYFTVSAQLENQAKS
ncbi:hypothetical protein H0I23_06045 [Cellulophaga sp. HaHaR_3_176]|uniref:tetratricopeptide repeat-containing sensor histidine kinase n=1 Tax=Cellulophaga sp. HaHaR_3_176 TaxID=1942464 RepID=UPI001C1F3F5C|nr:tetratricopeptide repeat-containing sensor histidine kinase [Cellulophaga sp. HaHaR_3_176]QWX85196.1 hypothetical protein H0I23_06045 [Cellulophaga sp. HaHaR_3_176]